MTATTPAQAGRTIRFRLGGTAAPKERVRHRLVRPKGKPAFVQVYTPAETVNYEKRVAETARRAWGDAAPTRRPVELQVTVYLEIPNGWPRWKQEAAARGEIAPTGKPDLDNYVKAIADGMNGTVYTDDAQICAIDAVKLYAPQGSRGYVEVSVRENYRCGSWIARILDLVLLR
jgi:Holliday junction resolvase RusA-like endonuclease